MFCLNLELYLLEGIYPDQSMPHLVNVENRKKKVVKGLFRYLEVEPCFGVIASLPTISGVKWVR